MNPRRFTIRSDPRVGPTDRLVWAATSCPPREVRGIIQPPKSQLLPKNHM